MTEFEKFREQLREKGLRLDLTWSAEWPGIGRSNCYHINGQVRPNAPRKVLVVSILDHNGADLGFVWHPLLPTPTEDIIASLVEEEQV